MPKFTVKIKHVTTTIGTFEGVSAPDEDAAVEKILNQVNRDGPPKDVEFELEDEEYDYEEVNEE